MGGSGPHEGNIFVGGKPVCDDHHDAENALVVCRLAKNKDSVFLCIISLKAQMYTSFHCCTYVVFSSA